MRKRKNNDQDQVEQAIDDVLLGRKRIDDTCLPKVASTSNVHVDDYIDKMRRKLAPAIAEQCKELLEHELQEIQSGALTLPNAATFYRVARYNKQTIEYVYNDVFESVCERLQAEEEQSVSGQIDVFLGKFPAIFSQLERKGIVDKFRSILDEAKSRMFGRARGSNERPWCCIEPHGTPGMGLFASAIVGGGSEQQVGESVELVTGERGLLMCSHEMGLTPLDLFNDIVTDPSDMKNFLGESLSRENDRPETLAIKSYLKFCRLTNNEPWDPERDYFDMNDQVLAIGLDPETQIKVECVDDFEDDIELIETGELIDSQDDFDIFSEIINPSGQHQPKKAKKQKKVKESSKIKGSVREEEIEEVLKCCDICHPGNQELAFNVGQTMFDKILSRHMFEVHKIEDNVRQFHSYMAQTRNKLSVDNHSFEEQTMKCLVAGCTFQYPMAKYQANLHRIARHVEYHRELKAANKTTLIELGEDGEEVVLYPCDKCDIDPFVTYSEVCAHRNRQHPDFMFNCRDRTCSFSSWNTENRSRHWQMVHECRKHTCDICGKSYKDICVFNNHMKGHDKSNEATCEMCGKVFPTPMSFREHKKRVHQKTKPCPICGELFRRVMNVESHLVHEHGQERKYACPHCPQRFIQHKHRKRHIDNFHGVGGKTLQRMPQRGPNRQVHPSNNLEQLRLEQHQSNSATQFSSLLALPMFHTFQ